MDTIFARKGAKVSETVPGSNPDLRHLLKRVDVPTVMETTTVET